MVNSTPKTSLPTVSGLPTVTSKPPRYLPSRGQHNHLTILLDYLPSLALLLLLDPSRGVVRTIHTRGGTTVPRLPPVTIRLPTVTRR